METTDNIKKLVELKKLTAIIIKIWREKSCSKKFGNFMKILGAAWFSKKIENFYGMGGYIFQSCFQNSVTCPVFHMKKVSEGII